MSPVRHDRVRARNRTQRGWVEAAALHVVFRGDLDEIDGQTAFGSPCHQLVQEFPAQAKADPRDVHKIFLFVSLEQVPAPQLASPA